VDRLSDGYKAELREMKDSSIAKRKQSGSEKDEDNSSTDTSQSASRKRIKGQGWYIRY